jgi:hypothetical protein
MVPPKMTIADLEPDRPVMDLDLVVLRRYPARNVVGRKYSGLMAAACARDRSGVVGLLLWGDDVHRIRPGHAIRVERGWCRARDGGVGGQHRQAWSIATHGALSISLRKHKEG